MTAQAQKFAFDEDFGSDRRSQGQAKHGAKNSCFQRFSPEIVACRDFARTLTIARFTPHNLYPLGPSKIKHVKCQLRLTASIHVFSFRNGVIAGSNREPRGAVSAILRSDRGDAVVLGAVAVWGILTNIGTQGNSVATWVNSIAVPAAHP